MTKITVRTYVLQAFQKEEGQLSLAHLRSETGAPIAPKPGILLRKFFAGQGDYPLDVCTGYPYSRYMAKQKFTVSQFFKRFPDDESCLKHLFVTKYGETMDCPKCGKHGKFSKLTDMPAFQCSWCAYRIHPMVGTPFEKSRTPLQKWFYALYLFTTSRHGVPAKELERQLGVTYKCAWRMGHEIRKYMTRFDGDNGSFGGHVEADEAFVGGRKKIGKLGKGPTKSEIMASKAIVFGVVEHGGDIQTYVVPTRKRLEYLGEFKYRYNMRGIKATFMFDRLLVSF